MLFYPWGRFNDEGGGLLNINPPPYHSFLLFFISKINTYIYPNFYSFSSFFISKINTYIYPDFYSFSSFLFPKLTHIYFVFILLSLYLICLPTTLPLPLFSPLGVHFLFLCKKIIIKILFFCNLFIIYENKEKIRSNKYE